MKSMKSLSQDRQSQAQDSNPGHPEYEAEVLHFTVMLNHFFTMEYIHRLTTLHTVPAPKMFIFSFFFSSVPDILVP